MKRKLEDEGEWKTVIAASLKNLFSFANIPQGLAHTTALKENFYCVVLCAINKWPLLITGPPGCGKTLSFILACDTLRGRCPTHSVAFQSIIQAKKVMYQCSVASTGPEIAAVFHDAHLKQEYFEAQQPGRNVCLVGLDEAGLTPENRQALKSTHDFLGEINLGSILKYYYYHHYHEHYGDYQLDSFSQFLPIIYLNCAKTSYLDMRVIGTVMMSNTTLDAAKTSRTIQLLQTHVRI